MYQLIKRGWAGVFVCTWVLGLTGCVVTTEFYLPSAQGGRVEKAHCPPVSSFILFKREGAVIGAKATRLTNGHLQAIVTFEVPQGVSLRLLEGHVSVSNDNGDRGEGLLAPIGPHQGLAWDHEWVGSTRKRFWEQVTLYDTTEHSYVVFRATFDFPESQSLQIVLPKLLINGSETSLPPIALQGARESWLFSGNC